MIVPIALGSNIPSEFGGPAENLREAIRRMDELGHIVAVSDFFTTAPVGYKQQPDFVNAAVLLETDFLAVDLMHDLLLIEKSMGRERSADVPAKGPRIIDLDLLLYGGLILDDVDLTLPHPSMHERRFVLEPLAEIAPQIVHPVLQKTIAELLAALPSET